ncbi:proteasome inhibitor PI31 subunit [Astyanax mexicanus]|uniref:Proteasome inhibitor PI31 subunit n=1 Tax=Astyanax mexicanus TaxID=7994 RepID=A0A8B9LB68_ASTMX|nr:proteasome inhibitor PI31 subunit [Astyanax mexicanus]KAG9277937.1 proteasome inhibitor PI31 subunit [Astyanax mexicanus]
MAGLEVLYSGVLGSVSCAQDAAVCFVHWEIIKSGFKCLGTGDQPRDGEKKSELLPAAWNASKELYTLRYRSSDDKSNLLLKAITVDSTLIFNFMDSATDRVTDLTITVSDYVDENSLQTFDSVFKNTEDLVKKLKSSLLPAAKTEKKEKRERPPAADTRPNPDHDPLRIPSRVPPTARPPNWTDPMAPFAAGGADLDPFGGRAGGMIVDPLRAGFPRSGFDPTGGIPGVLPPGAVPPGARFDPFGPVGRHRPGPDPDHLPPPGYDDMFM